MSQRKKFIIGVFGVIIGLCIGSLLRNYHTLEIVSMCNSMTSFKQKSPLEIISLHSHETPNNSQRNLVFVGVMTAKNYLKGRASAVYNTWGKNVPGRIAFFSSEDSFSEELPLVALKGVDDRYPPQKKSFMMLHYMYEHYIDKFEWFARADDDVFVRTDKLEKFLRSVDSSKVQFIGQAGRGNSEEFGLLSLEYDENFCMGGPGVILSQETLRKVAPHIPTCLKNLYSTHEDVEIGRCVQKFAGIPCTWNYEMQTIFHHNSSGNRAFTGNLKNKEVHSAITLHPIKKAPLMYRMHTYMLGLNTQELRQESLYLHRDITQMIDLLGIEKSRKELAMDIPIFSKSEYNKNYLGDPTTSGEHFTGTNPDLNRYKPTNNENILEWDFIAKSIYSSVHANPKRKIESPMKEGLDDVIREIMENINNFSRQRGRVIEFRELLYGYTRTNTMFGQDLILDLLLVYKKYRGKKMTVPVRRHLYIQRSFTEIRIREMTSGHRKGDETESTKGGPISQNDHVLSKHETMDVQLLNQPKAWSPRNSKFNQISDKMKYYLNSGLEKLTDTLSLPVQDRTAPSDEVSKIVFVLPLAGRYETLLRFLNNYEDVCLTSNTNTDLLITLFQDAENTTIATLNVLNHLNSIYPKRKINYILLPGNFSRGLAIDQAIRSNYVKNDDILLFIDVDILFTATTLERIRKNTIQHHQVYLPIVFSEYNPERTDSTMARRGDVFSSGQQVMAGSGANVMVTTPVSQRNYSPNKDYQHAFAVYIKHLQQLQIDNDSGYFRQFGYGIVTIYKSDILHPDIDGFVTDIKGWGLEDVKFLEKIISSNHKPNQKILNIADGKDDFPAPDASGHVTLNVFRAADTSLVHIYHPIVCDKHLEEAQYKMCLGTLGNTLGNHKLLENYFLRNKFIIDYAKSSRSSNNYYKINNKLDDERGL